MKQRVILIGAKMESFTARDTPPPLTKSSRAWKTQRRTGRGSYFASSKNETGHSRQGAGLFVLNLTSPALILLRARPTSPSAAKRNIGGQTPMDEMTGDQRLGKTKSAL